MIKLIALTTLVFVMHAGHAAPTRIAIGILDANTERVTIAIQPICDVTRVAVVARGSDTNTELRAVTVSYRGENTKPTRFDVGRRLSEDESTGWLNLPGSGSFCVTGVALSGRSLIASKYSQLDVYVDRRQANENDGAKLIGRARLTEGDSLIYNDVKDVCGLNKVRLHVTGDSANIEYLAVRFRNGDFQQVDVRERFAEDSVSEWKDLDGSKRCVSGFLVVGSSDKTKGASRVSLEGR